MKLDNLTKQNLIPKFIALVLVSIGAAWLMMYANASTLKILDSMSPADVVKVLRKQNFHTHPFVFHFFRLLLAFVIYFGVIEFFTYVIASLFKKKPDA